MRQGFDGANLRNSARSSRRCAAVPAVEQPFITPAKQFGIPALACGHFGAAAPGREQQFRRDREFGHKYSRPGRRRGAGGSCQACSWSVRGGRLTGLGRGGDYYWRRSGWIDLGRLSGAGEGRSHDRGPGGASEAACGRIVGLIWFGLSRRFKFWTHWAEQQERVIRFREIPELGLTQDYTYHVDRARFDQLLLQHAARQGSRVLQGTRVERVEFDAKGAAVGVRVEIGGQERLLRCRLVVDASGRSTVLGSQLRLKKHDALFDQFAVHNWFEGVDRGTAETAEYIHIHVLAMPRAWVWLIPINETVTSVGIVTRSADFPKGSESAKEFFARHIVNDKGAVRVY